MEHDGWTYIFLRGGRKAWHLDQHKAGWLEVAHERGDYIECGVYRKRTSDVTADDTENWISVYGERPRDGEWFDPSDWQDPRRSLAGTGTEPVMLTVSRNGCDRFADAVKLIVQDASNHVADDFRKGRPREEYDKWLEVINVLEDRYPDIVKPFMADRGGKGNW